jgi:DNA-binding FadR family transcriptional regulator
MPLSDNPIHRARRSSSKLRYDLDLSGRRDGGDDLVPNRSAQDNLVNRLGQEIVAGIFPSGSLLPHELEMRKRFSVSRTALREAYRVLAGKAMIAARPKVGTGIRPKSEWNMLDPQVLAWHLQTLPAEDFVDDLHVLRQMVEPAAAAIAASARTAEMLERIAAAYADMERFKDGSGDLIAADASFHLAILAATGNAFVGALGSLIRAALYATFELSWEGAARIQDDRLRQHRLILDAIRDRKPELARRRMTELLRDSLQDVRDYISRGKAD